MIAGYRTFSSLPHARGVDTRLVSRYVDQFDCLRVFCENDGDPFPSQRDATRDWQDINDGVVAAVEWCFLTRECSMVLVLADDEEFGRDVNWYFSPGCTGLLDVKDAIVLAEQYLDVAIAFARDAAMPGALRGEPAGTWHPSPGLVVRSPLFCYAIAPGSAVPPALSGRLRTSPGAWPATGVFHPPRAGGIAGTFSWDILAGARGVLDAGAGPAGLAIEASPAITGVLGEHLLAIAATQLRLLDRLLASTGGA